MAITNLIIISGTHKKEFYIAMVMIKIKACHKPVIFHRLKAGLPQACCKPSSMPVAGLPQANLFIRAIIMNPEPCLILISFL